MHIAGFHRFGMIGVGVSRGIVTLHSLFWELQMPAGCKPTQNVQTKNPNSIKHTYSALDEACSRCRD